MRVSGTFRINALLVYAALVADVFVGAYTDITYTFSASLDVMAVILQARACSPRPELYLHWTLHPISQTLTFQACTFHSTLNSKP